MLRGRMLHNSKYEQIIYKLSMDYRWAFPEYFSFRNDHSSLWKGERRVYTQRLTCKDASCHIIYNK